MRMNEYYDEALQLFARRNGRYWKNALRGCWITGDYRYCHKEHIGRLQELRNMAAFGPSGLIRYRLYDPTQDKSK
jgi:hypothetical protein